jgi:hypothetical protein
VGVSTVSLLSLHFEGGIELKNRVQWSACELLKKHGFDDGEFITPYGEQRLPALECPGDGAPQLGQGSHLSGEDFPEYVLCLVELLRARGLEYIVLREPVGSHNTDIIDSFVYAGRHYIVDSYQWQQWFSSLPEPLQQIFNETKVTVEIPDQEK